MKRVDFQANVEALNRPQLTSVLTPQTLAALNSLEIFQEIDSTNAYLLAQSPPPQGALTLALAEYQTAGRGRRGRAWSMPFGSGVMLSIGWCFQQPPVDVSALTLAFGVAARDALLALGVSEVLLKWPNDLVWQQGKLGGILVEMTRCADQSCYVVVGIGINFALDEWARSSIESRWGRGPVDIRQATGGARMSRNQLAAGLVNEMHRVCSSYPGSGFAPYRARWSEADFLAGRRVSVVVPEGAVVGHAAGVDSDGALLVATTAGPRRVTSGEVLLQDEP